MEVGNEPAAQRAGAAGGRARRFLGTHLHFSWSLIGTLACASVIPLKPSLLEEGFIVDIAQRLLRGDHLYRDVVTFTGPLPYEGLRALFFLFGEHIILGRIVVALLHGLATGGVFSLARSAKAGPVAHTAAAVFACSPILLFPMLSTYFYSTVALTLAIIATDATFRGLRSNGWALSGGALVACTALCKQTIGVVLAVSLLSALLLNVASQARMKRCLAFIGGGAIVTLLTLAFYAQSGDLDVLVHSLTVLPLTFEPSFNSPYMNFWPLGKFSQAIEPSQIFYLPYTYSLLYGVLVDPGFAISLFTQLLYALPFIAIAATLLRRFATPFPAATWFHFAALIGIAINLFPRTDWGHLLFVLPTAATQLLFLGRTQRPESAGNRPSRRVVALAIGLTFVTASLVNVGYLYALSSPPSLGPRVPFRTVSGYSDWQVAHAISYLREHVEPGEAIFVARSEPLIYFATETRNPTPYGGVIPGMREEQQRVILAALEDLRFVVMSDIDQPVFTYYRDELPRVQAYLERHFQIPGDYLVRGSTWLSVLERGVDRGETAIDLVDRHSEGKAWVRDAEGERNPEVLFSDRVAVRLNRRFLPFYLGALGGGIDFELDIPPNAIFQGDVGYPQVRSTHRNYRHPLSSRLRVSIKREAKKPKKIAVTREQHLREREEAHEEFEVLWERQVLINRKSSLFREAWIPMEVDLSEYAGEHVTLRLELASTNPLPRIWSEDIVGWWGSPRIALSAGETSARQ